MEKYDAEPCLKSKQIIFSEFLTEVDNGRVVQVEIQGNNIKGIMSNGEKFLTYSPNYPNLIDAWYGFKNEIIDGLDFKRIALAYKKREFPPQDTKLGGQIGIHGIGKITKQKLAIHQDLNWTDGCIALTNHDINDLMKYIDIGTMVVIKE